MYEQQCNAHSVAYKALCSDEVNPSKFIIENDMGHLHLTLRELECIKWTAAGKTSYETGIILGISRRTVERHLENTKTKLNCVNRYQLISKVIDLGLIDLPI